MNYVKKLAVAGGATFVVIPHNLNNADAVITSRTPSWNTRVYVAVERLGAAARTANDTTVDFSEPAPSTGAHFLDVRVEA